MIQKIIHQIWLGDNEIPKRLLLCQEQMKKLHPSWDYKFHTDESILAHPDLEPIKDKLLAFYDKLGTTQDVRKLSFKADLLRMCIIYVYGGIYLDLDMWAVQSLDDLLDQPLILALIKASSFFVAEAVIGAPDHSPILHQMLDHYMCKQVTTDGIISPLLARFVRDRKLERYCHDPMVFIPHPRHPRNDDERYDYNKSTKTIHLWSERQYSFKTLKEIATNLGNKQ